MKIEFYKYHGTGNDFIILDNRNNIYDLTQKQVARMCDRHFGIGADGLMLLNLKEGYDFEMKYYNADGAEGTMCGNGGRCMVKFAYKLGIRKAKYLFLAADGEHRADIDMNDLVHLRMKDVNSIEVHSNHFIVNTGSPHYVKPSNNVAEMDVKAAGRLIRYSKEFEKDGINVNFIETMEGDRIYVRTYERGVEDETLSCGTGVTAAALVSAHNDNGFNRVEIKTQGGNLSVEFDKLGENKFENIFLIGPAQFVFKGEIDVVN